MEKILRRRMSTAKHSTYTRKALISSSVIPALGTTALPSSIQRGCSKINEAIKRQVKRTRWSSTPPVRQCSFHLTAFHVEPEHAQFLHNPHLNKQKMRFKEVLPALRFLKSLLLELSCSELTSVGRPVLLLHSGPTTNTDASATDWDRPASSSKKQSSGKKYSLSTRSSHQWLVK